MPPGAVALADSEAARLRLAEPDPSLPADDGRNDYAGALDPDLTMERFSSAALSAIADEVALQGQLLARAYLLEVADRAVPADVTAIGIAQASGIAGLTTKRLAAALGLEPTLDGLAAVLEVHPLFLPRTYVDVVVADRTTDGGTGVTVTLHPCAALDEDDGLTWAGLLAGAGGDEILRSAVICLLPTARVERVDVDGVVAAWSISDDPDAEPATQPDAVTLTEFSTGADFAFQRRTPT